MIWEEKNGMLVKEFSFDSFIFAVEFVNKIVPVAESMQHHPDIDIRYNKVMLRLMTHSEGKITEKDRELAEKIDEL
jgi:4a-hydroxytetrahydrobiopterin dehydratase